MFSENVFPPAPPPITAWFLGSFIQRAHNVQGMLYALDNKTILLSGFHFDGNAPGNPLLLAFYIINTLVIITQPLTFELLLAPQASQYNMQ